MRYSIRTVTPLGDVPQVLSLADAKAHLRVEDDDEDAVIAAYAVAAQDAVEQHCGQVLTPRVLEMADWRFPCAGFDIPRDPVTSIVSIAYTDGTGADIDLGEAAWRWSESAPNLVRAAWATTWPSAASETGSVRLQFEAGYEAGLCPGSLVQAVKMMTAHMYGNREPVNVGNIVTEFPLGVKALCAPYRRVIL